jgi:hypothetical protein
MPNLGAVRAAGQIARACAIPITGYIYGPFEVLPDYSPPIRLVFFRIMLLSGLWM